MTPPDPLPSLDPELSAHYRIEREVGRGGMATVYLAPRAITGNSCDGTTGRCAGTCRW